VKSTALLVAAVGALSFAISPAQAQLQTKLCRQIDTIASAGTPAQSARIGATANRPCVRVEFERDGFIVTPKRGFVGSDRFVASWLVRSGRVTAETPVQDNGPGAAAADAAFILRQVLAAWRVDYRNARYRNVTLRVRFVLNADGTLAPPWARGNDWEPERVIAGHRDLAAPERNLVESFARAVWSAQPYQVPPTPGRYPRSIVLNFRMGDL
jgi:hypothetical protein